MRTSWLLGLAAGGMFLYYELEAIGKDIAGTPFSYQFPFGLVAVLTPVILLAALISAIVPGETSFAINIVASTRS